MLKWLRIVFLAWPRVLYDYLFHILPYSRHPERYPIELRFHHIAGLIRFLLRVFRADIYLEGAKAYHEAELKKEGLLLTPDHMGDFDPLLLLALSHRPLRPVAKIETRRYPVIGRAIRALDGLFMDRKDLRQSLGVIKEVSDGLAAGKDYLIFPEGTRNRDPMKVDVLPFHPGSFKAVTRSGARLLPTAIFGTFRLFKVGPDDQRIPLQVAFLPSFVPGKGAMTDELAPNVEAAVGSAVAKARAFDQAYYEKGYHRVPLKKKIDL